MKFHVFIKKVTFTPEVDSKYWGSFGKLLELPFTDSQVMTLISFFEAAENYRSFVLNNLTFPQGTMIKYLKLDDNSQEGFLFYGLINASHYQTVVKHGPEYLNMYEKKDLLYKMLGWVESEERVVEIESEPDMDNVTWPGVPTNFAEGQDFFERGIPVSEFFKGQ